MLWLQTVYIFNQSEITMKAFFLTFDFVVCRGEERGAWIGEGHFCDFFIRGVLFDDWPMKKKWKGF